MSTYSTCAVVILWVFCLPSILARDSFDVLGVEKSASDTQLRRAYRRIGIQFHPKYNPTPAALSRFEELSIAYDSLIGEIT